MWHRVQTPKPTLSPEQEHLESFDQDWESFPPEELPEHCGVSDVFYWNKHPQKPVDNPWAKLGPKKKVRCHRREWRDPTS